MYLTKHGCLSRRFFGRVLYSASDAVHRLCFYTFLKDSTHVFHLHTDSKLLLLFVRQTPSKYPLLYNFWLSSALLSLCFPLVCTKEVHLTAVFALRVNIVLYLKPLVSSLIVDRVQGSFPYFTVPLLYYQCSVPPLFLFGFTFLSSPLH